MFNPDVEIRFIAKINTPNNKEEYAANLQAFTNAVKQTLGDDTDITVSFTEKVIVIKASDIEQPKPTFTLVK